MKITGFTHKTDGGITETLAHAEGERTIKVTQYEISKIDRIVITVAGYYIDGPKKREIFASQSGTIVC